MVSRKSILFAAAGINLIVLVAVYSFSSNSETTIQTNGTAILSVSSNSYTNGNDVSEYDAHRLDPVDRSQETFLSNSSASYKTDTVQEAGDPVTVTVRKFTSTTASHEIVIVEVGTEADLSDNTATDGSTVRLNTIVVPGDLLLRFPDQNNFKSIPCDDYYSSSHLGQRGSFWVFYNYVKATRQFACNESITYTTHADYTFLDNIVPLLERWQGPMSLSLYCPGDDYEETLIRIQYLRECSSPLVKELVTFHLFFNNEQVPQNITKTPLKMWEEFPANCSAQPEFGENIVTFKKEQKLLYPVNVGRNVAREMAQTHYVLASDIELYPNPNLISNFLDMIRSHPELQGPKPQIFVLPIFEVEANVTALPFDKAELQAMLNKNVAIPFHKYICSGCHSIPKQKEWRKAKMTTGLSVFHTGKRQKPYQRWEPIYIGTKLDPIYDERLTWDGRRDKMTQAYVLCVLDYDFHILDNAFLVHRPGIKRKIIPGSNPIVKAQNVVIDKHIRAELQRLYGTRPGCHL